MQNQSFEAIVQAYSAELKQLAWRYVMDSFLAEDIVQEALLKCFIHYDQLEDPRCIRAWLYTITRNQCKDYLRTKYHQKVVPTSEFFLPTEDTTESEVMIHQTQEEFESKIRNLPKKYQEILTLFYLQELKIIEIQRCLNLNISTVKSRLFRGKRLLQAAMTL